MRTRPRHISVWMNDTEYHHLRRQAELAGMKVDPFIRNLIMGVELQPRPPDTYGALLRELHAIGNNVNQIAKWANAKKGITDPEMETAAALIRKAWRLVKDSL